MNKHSLLFLLLIGLHAPVDAVEIVIPDDEQSSTIQIDDPDAQVYTERKPEIIFDLSASHDDLFDLKIRRSGLLLKGDRPFTAFAGHKEEDLVVIAGGSVASINIAGVSGTGKDRKALILFRKQDGSVMTPPPENVSVFNADFEKLSFDYRPLRVPDGTSLPISILIDVSGSMDGHIEDIKSAIRHFLSILPPFARCRIFTFNENVSELTRGTMDCRNSAAVLHQDLNVGGNTELFNALDFVFEENKSAVPSWERGMPNITLVITDGIDSGILPKDRSIVTNTRKVAMDNHLFVFWAGNFKPEHLKGLADLQVSAGSDLKGELERFFSALGVSLSGLQTITVKGQ